MKYPIITTILFQLVLSFSVNSQELLKLITIKQLKAKHAFELSGLASSAEHGILAIGDNKKNVYKIDTAHNWTIQMYANIKPPYPKKESDLEGIDICGGNIYILDEYTSAAYLVGKKGNLSELKVDYATFEKEKNINLGKSKWENAGYEGLAYNCKDEILYLAKERAAKDVGDSRYILVVDLKENGKIIEKFNLPETQYDNDFTDLKFINKDGKNYLYILHRNDYQVSRIDLKTKEVISYSFKSYCVDDQKKLALFKAKKPEFGIAESLIILEKEIWIGLDNNNEKANENNDLMKKYHITGRLPIIMIFEKPKGF